MISPTQPTNPQNLGGTSPSHGPISSSITSPGSPQPNSLAQGSIASGLGFAQPSALLPAGIGGAIVPVGASNQLGTNSLTNAANYNSFELANEPFSVHLHSLDNFLEVLFPPGATKEEFSNMCKFYSFDMSFCVLPGTVDADLTRL